MIRQSVPCADNRHNWRMTIVDSDASGDRTPVLVECRDCQAQVFLDLVRRPLIPWIAGTGVAQKLGTLRAVQSNRDRC